MPGSERGDEKLEDRLEDLHKNMQPPTTEDGRLEDRLEDLHSNLPASSESSLVSPEMEEEIKGQEGLLQQQVAEVQTATEELASVSGEGREKWDWEKIQRAYDIAQTKVLGITAALGAGTFGTLVYAQQALQTQPDVFEKVITGSGTMAWASVVALLGGSLYNKIKKRQRMRTR